MIIYIIIIHYKIIYYYFNIINIYINIISYLDYIG